MLMGSEFLVPRAAPEQCLQPLGAGLEQAWRRWWLYLLLWGLGHLQAPAFHVSLLDFLEDDMVEYQLCFLKDRTINDFIVLLYSLLFV